MKQPKLKQHWFDRYVMWCMNTRGPIALPAVILLGPFFAVDRGPGPRSWWWQVGFIAAAIVTGLIAAGVLWRGAVLEAKPFWREAEKGRKY